MIRPFPEDADMITAEESTLYARMGGEAGIEALIRRLYERVLDDPELAHFFGRSAMDKLTRMQREFIGAALGGPQAYGGTELSWAHHGRGITVHHFGRFFQHLAATLEQLGAVPADVHEAMHRLAVYKNQITGEAY